MVCLSQVSFLDGGCEPFVVDIVQSNWQAQFCLNPAETLIRRYGGSAAGGDVEADDADDCQVGQRSHCPGGLA